MRFVGILLACTMSAISAGAERPAEISNVAGVRIVVTDEDTQPVLHLVVPGDVTGDTMKILLPEHVTAKRRGGSEAEHLYLFRPGKTGEAAAWRQTGRSMEYERDFKDGVHMLARATLEDDGVLFHYEFLNRSDADYEMITAPTDPRMTSVFRDERLERTYVHLKSGFDLLASETPSRLAVPMDQWLPARYLASYTWPIPEKLVDRRSDGITYYSKSRVVDEPMIATVSKDGRWVAASFTRTTGNVWSNPELTCQHVDPARALPAHGSVVWETKLLVFRGSLDEALKKVREQKETLK